MTSILPPGPIVGGCRGCLNQSSRKIEQLTGMYMGDGNNMPKSNFRGTKGKKRKNKKRPPPIILSVGSVNDFMGNMYNTNSHKDGIWTPPTPKTPPLVPCMKQLCKEVHDYLTTTPTFSQPTHHPDHIWPPRITSSTMSSAELPAELPANPSAAIAELPGSEPSQQKQQRTKEIHELDASSPTSTKTCVKLGKPENTPLQTPGLTPDSAPGPDMDRWGFPLRSSTGGEPKKNGKLLSMMSINELLAIHSELSPQEINDYWRPAITKECNIIQNVLKNLQREAANYPHIDPDIELGNSIEDTRTSEERKIHALKQENQFERNEFEFALTHKDSRKNSMREAYEAELAILSTFIDKFHSVEDNPDCPSAVQTIIEKYALNRHRNSNSSSDDSEFIFVRENDYVERNIQLEILKIHVADLEALTDFYEKKMIEHVRETRSMAKKINGYKKDEIIHNRNIVERDLQIAALNQKIGQVMKMYSPQSQRHGEPSSAPHASKYGKDLPSPSPSEWREQEGIEKKGQEAKYQGYKKEMMGRLPRHVIESDQMADRGRGGLRASDNSGSDVADRFQTLSVDEEDFPFYFAGDSF